MGVQTEKSHEHNEVNELAHQAAVVKIDISPETSTEKKSLGFKKKNVVSFGKKKKKEKASTAAVAQGTFDHILNSCCACWKGRDEIKTSPSIFDDELDVVPPPVKLAEPWNPNHSTKNNNNDKKPAHQRSDPLSEPSNPRFADDPHAGKFVVPKKNKSFTRHGDHQTTANTAKMSPLFHAYHTKPQVPDQPESDFTFGTGTSPEASRLATPTANAKQESSSGSAVPGHAVETPDVLTSDDSREKDLFQNAELLPSQVIHHGDQREQEVEEPNTPSSRSFKDIILRRGPSRSVSPRGSDRSGSNTPKRRSRLARWLRLANEVSPPHSPKHESSLEELKEKYGPHTSFKWRGSEPSVASASSAAHPRFS